MLVFFIFMMAVLLPALTQFGSPLYVKNINGTYQNVSRGFNQTIFNPIQKVSFNGTTGFNAQILQFTGVSFIFDGIATVMTAVTYMPAMFNLIIGETLFALGLPLPLAQLMAGIGTSFMFLSLILVGISAWMKYDIRNG